MPVILHRADYERWLGTESIRAIYFARSGPRRCGYGRSQRGSTSQRTTTPPFLTRFQPRRWKVSEQPYRAPKGRDADVQFRTGPIVHLDRPGGSGRTIGNRRYRWRYNPRTRPSDSHIGID